MAVLKGLSPSATWEDIEESDRVKVSKRETLPFLALLLPFCQRLMPFRCGAAGSDRNDRNILNQDSYFGLTRVEMNPASHDW